MSSRRGDYQRSAVYRWEVEHVHPKDTGTVPFDQAQAIVNYVWARAGLTQDALNQLVDAGLVFRRGVSPQAMFLFKHALVQEAALGTLLRRPRQLLLSPPFDIRASAILPWHGCAEIVAHHLQGAGRTADAIAYWREAGGQAARRSANREAIGHLRRALALVETQLSTTERWRVELAVLSQLTPALMSVYGWSGPEAGEAVERAAEIARRLPMPRGEGPLPLSQQCHPG